MSGSPDVLGSGSAGDARAALVDELATTIQRRILNGTIPAGARLLQETLAAEFGVSRTPIREALRKLQANGILAFEPHRGAVVRGLTPREIREAYEVRAELEGFAAELAASRIRENELASLREAQRRFVHAVESLREEWRGGAHISNDPIDDDWTQANDLFHQAIQSAAGNARLIEAVCDIHRSFPRALTWAALCGNLLLLDENVDEHRRILEAIESRDAAGARAAMTAHVRHAGELVTLEFERHTGFSG